jgi:cold shock CspA family protein
MKPYYHGFVIFFRARQEGADFGFLYCPEQDRTYFFNGRSLAKEQAAPQVGDAVDFREGATQVEGKEPLATSVKSTQIASATEGFISLTAVAQVYRQPVARLRQLLGSTTVDGTLPERISIAQLLTIANLMTGARASEQPRKQLPPRYIGQIVRYREENGYGFIEQPDQEDVFVHVRNAAPNILVSGAWVVFTQSAHPHEPTKLRATNVTALASETSYIQANLGTFPDATLRILLEHGPESLREPIISQELARIGDSSTFEQAQQVLVLAEKYWHREAAYYRELIGQRLAGPVAWYWWQHYGLAEEMPPEALAYYKEEAPKLRGNPDDGFDLMGVLLLDELPPAHFVGLFQVCWPYARVLEAVETGQGQELLQDCRYAPLIGTAEVGGYDSAVISASGSDEVRKAMWLMRYLASLDVVGLAELIWDSLRILLPISRFAANPPTEAGVDALRTLLAYDITEVSLAVVPQLFDQLRYVETEADFTELSALFRLCRQLSEANVVELATELVLQKTSPFFKVRLWILGLLPSQDIYQLVAALPTPEITRYLHDAHMPVRLPAAITLALRAAEMGSHTGMQEGLRVLQKSRKLLKEVDFVMLLQVQPATAAVYSEVSAWLTTGQGRPANPVLLPWLLAMPVQGDSERLAFIKLLEATDQAELLKLVVRTDNTRMLGLSSSLIIHWLLLLEEDARMSLQQQLTQSRRSDLLLALWVGGHSDFFDFGRYYLLVATLPREQQFLFLRKVFGLMKAGAVSMTVEDLNTIPRHSREDENPLGRRLDYSIDLVLRVLMLLKRKATYPSENDIIDCLITYAGNSTKEVLQFSYLFADCPDRTSVTHYREDREIVKAVIGSKTYPAAPDKSYVEAGGEQLPVVGDAIFFKDKRYPIQWKNETETHWPWKYYREHSNGKRNVSCCEGKKALAVHKVTGEAFWWCYGRACHKANQTREVAEEWEQFVLKDFIKIAGLPFDEEAYYRAIGLINRTNELLSKLYCKECGIMLRPAETSDYNFFRVTKFNCTAEECSQKGKVIYLNRCLNGNCGAIIDSRISTKCNYEDLGQPNWHGLYICHNCGGCCSRQKLLQQIDKLKSVYGEAVKNNLQYKSFVRQLELKLYHADHFKSFCYRCLNPMQKNYEKSDYYCPTCDGVKYNHSVAYLTVYKKRMAAVIDEETLSVDGE